MATRPDIFGSAPNLADISPAHRSVIAPSSTSDQEGVAYEDGFHPAKTRHPIRNWAGMALTLFTLKTGLAAVTHNALTSPDSPLSGAAQQVALWPFTDGGNAHGDIAQNINTQANHTNETNPPVITALQANGNVEGQPQEGSVTVQLDTGKTYTFVSDGDLAVAGTPQNPDSDKGANIFMTVVVNTGPDAKITLVATKGAAITEVSMTSASTANNPVAFTRDPSVNGTTQIAAGNAPHQNDVDAGRAPGLDTPSFSFKFYAPDGHGNFVEVSGNSPVNVVTSDGTLGHMVTDENGNATVVIPPHSSVTLGSLGAISIKGSNENIADADPNVVNQSDRTITNNSNSAVSIELKAQAGTDLVAVDLPDTTQQGADVTASLQATMRDYLKQQETGTPGAFTTTVEKINQPGGPLIPVAVNAIA